MNPARLTAFIGARPNLPKAWTLQRALEGLRPDVTLRTIHTGQHFTSALGTGMASELGVRIDMQCVTPPADSDAQLLGRLMQHVKSELMTHPPDAVIAVGDVNTSLAAALVAAREGIPIIHLEAGLRSRDGCPEEINRRVISTLAGCHLCPTRLATENLAAEGIDTDTVHFVGNAMIECRLRKRAETTPDSDLERHGVGPGEYVLATAHKPLTLSDPDLLIGLLRAAAEQGRPVLFACHPHTREVLRDAGVLPSLPAGVVVLPPLGYLEFAALVDCAAALVTDSDGLQEECCVTQTPCLIMSNSTARPECLNAGAVLVGRSPARLRDALVRAHRRTHTLPERWDTEVSSRICAAVLAFSRSLTGPRSWHTRPAQRAPVEPRREPLRSAR